jgi:hypothetical protein
MADKEIALQKRVVANYQIKKTEKLKTEQWLPEDERALQEAIAKEENLRTESAGRMIRGQKQLYAALKAIRDDEFKLALLQTEGNDEATKKVLKEQLDFELQNTELTNTQQEILKFEYQKAIDKIDEDGFEKFKAYWDKQDKVDEDRRKANIKAGIEYKKLKADNEAKYGLETTAILSEALDTEYQAMVKSVDYERMTDNEKLLIDEQYTTAKRKLSLQRVKQMDQEKTMIADAFGAMSELIGKQTAAGKAFAVAQATINTWVAASQALADPTIPSTLARVALMISIIATGLVNVRNILKVDTSGKSVSASSPTAISSAPATQRVFANQVGSSILTQPALSQAQLNTLPNQNLLTAADIANALKNLPNPIVTVEDINARIAAKKKVEVRATI